MTHEELEDAVPLYAVGALERVERQALEAHLLSGCVSCHSALKEYQSVAAVLPFGLNTAVPPRGLKAKIMAARTPAALAAEMVPKVPANPSLEPGEWMNHLFPPEPSARARSLGWALGITVIALVGGGGILAWDAYSRIAEDSERLTQLQGQADAAGRHIAVLQQQVAERDQVLTRLREDLQQRVLEIAELSDRLVERDAELEEARIQMTHRGGKLRSPHEELAALLRTPDVQAVSLTGSDAAKHAAGFLLFDPRTRKTWLFSVNLPECPRGMIYQLWAMDDRPTSLGTFHMSSGETAHLLVKQVLEPINTRQFAVSLEPRGGRPHPTGAIYLASAPLRP